MVVNKEVALVVFSGGQDSTTCLFWAKREFKRVVALSFLYGQKHEKEVELAREIAGKASVEFEAMDVSCRASRIRAMTRFHNGVVIMCYLPFLTWCCRACRASGWS